MSGTVGCCLPSLAFSRSLPDVHLGATAAAILTRGAEAKQRLQYKKENKDHFFKEDAALSEHSL